MHVSRVYCNLPPKIGFPPFSTMPWRTPPVGNSTWPSVLSFQRWVLLASPAIPRRHRCHLWTIRSCREVGGTRKDAPATKSGAKRIVERHCNWNYLWAFRYSSMPSCLPSCPACVQIRVSFLVVQKEPFIYSKRISSNIRWKKPGVMHEISVPDRMVEKPVMIHGMMPYYLLSWIAGFFWEDIPFPGYRYRWKKPVIIPGMMPYYLLSAIAGLELCFRDTSTTWPNGIHVQGHWSMRIHVKWQYGSTNLKHFSLFRIAKRWRQNFHFPRHVVLAGFLQFESSKTIFDFEIRFSESVLMRCSWRG